MTDYKASKRIVGTSAEILEVEAYLKDKWGL